MLLFRKKLPQHKILIFSDIHSYGDDIKKVLANPPECDLVITLGDIPRDIMYRIRETIPADIKILYVLGNHDIHSEYEGISNIISLHQRSFEFDGIHFYGLSGSTRYKRTTDYVMYSQDAFHNLVVDIPQETKIDILCTHDAPYHLLNYNRGESHEGFQALVDLIKQKKPYIHIFGHHHVDTDLKLGSTKESCIFKCAILDTKTLKIKRLINF